jgi:hypothetical protein
MVFFEEDSNSVNANEVVGVSQNVPQNFSFIQSFFLNFRSKVFRHFLEVFLKRVLKNLSFFLLKLH